MNITILNIPDPILTVLSWLATLVISLTGDDLFLPQLSHVINDAATLDYDLLGRDKKQPPWEGSRVPDSCRLQDRILVMLRALTSKHVDITKYLLYLAVYLFIVPLMESDGVGHISLDKWFPIVQHLHSRKNSGLNNPPVPASQLTVIWIDAASRFCQNNSWRKNY